jgi:hypothetical protein
MPSSPIACLKGCCVPWWGMLFGETSTDLIVFYKGGSQEELPRLGPDFLL